MHAITGGAGFIGSHLSEVLLEQGQSVVVIDSMSNGQAEWLQGVRSHPRFRFCNADVRDTAAVCEIIRGAYAVWHLAASTNMVVGAESTRVDLENGIIATHSVLEAMKTVGVHNLLFASSGAVYGDIEQPPASEELRAPASGLAVWRMQTCRRRPYQCLLQPLQDQCLDVPVW